MSKIPVCNHCGSDNVLIDAYARWSPDEHEWTLNSEFEDVAVCESSQCNGSECQINWIEPEEPPKGIGADDYTLAPASPLGGKTRVMRGQCFHVGTFEDDEAALLAVALDMKHQQFWPNAWQISDHGNVTLLTVPELKRYRIRARRVEYLSAHIWAFDREHAERVEASLTGDDYTRDAGGSGDIEQDDEGPEEVTA